MNGSNVYLGVDAGLSRVTVGAYDTTGQRHAIESCPTPSSVPQVGHHEVGPEQLWESVTSCIRGVVAKIGTDRIVGVGVGGHGHGAYLLDAQGSPVHPAIRSTDGRAASVVHRWNEEGKAAEVKRILGYEPFAADPLSILGWFQAKNPEILSDLATLCFCKDYIRYRLTGKIATDTMEASVFTAPGENEYAAHAFDVLDLDVSVDILPPKVDSLALAGRVSSAAAEQTGLLRGIPVATGLQDIGTTALGLGAHKPGQAILIVGTWGQSIIINRTGEAQYNEGGLRRRFIGNSYIQYQGFKSATASLDWFTEELGRLWEAQACRENKDLFDVYDAVIESVPIGARGVLFHPYIAGSVEHPQAQGGFFGLNIQHSAEDLLRAVYEGIALAIGRQLKAIAPEQTSLDVRLGGGGARSKIWSEIFAGVVDSQITLTHGDEPGARGAAICGAMAAGSYDDLSDAIDAFVAPSEIIFPNSVQKQQYSALRARFDILLNAMQPTWEHF